MIRPTTTLAVAVGLILAASVRGEPPQIGEISPLGVRRGTSSEITVRGDRLGPDPELVAPFDCAVDSITKDGDAWRLTIRVGPEVPLGVYPIRIRTEGGLSNPFLLTVGQLPQLAEAEENDTFDLAQEIRLPVAVEGQAKGNDVDFFRFEGHEGDRIVVDALCNRIGSGVDPTIRLTTAARAYVASADDSPGLLTDARLVATLPEDGDYLIELSDSQYQGGNRPVYRLVVGALPVADEVYPLGGRRGETVGFELRGGTLVGVERAAATLGPEDGGDATRIRVSGVDPTLDLEPIGPRVVGDLPELREPADPEAAPLRAVAPVVLNGRIDPAGDVDRFVLAVKPGQTLRMRMEAAGLGSTLDGQLRVIGAKGAVIASDDDSEVPPIPSLAKAAAKKATPTLSFDPILDVTVPAGLDELTVEVSDLEGRGGIGFPYRLVVEPADPAFELLLTSSEANVPRGGTLAIEVSAIRQGYDGPIALGVADPPPGLTARPGGIAKGQAAGVLTLSAASDADFGPTVLRIEGRAEPSGGTIVRRASSPLVFAKQGTLPTNLIMQPGLPAVPTSPGPLALETSDEPIEVVHGHEATIPIRIRRDEGADAALEFSALNAPPGLEVSKAKADPDASEFAVTVKASTDVPLGRAAVVVVAQGKLGETEQTIAAPAVQLDVVRPLDLELAESTFGVEAGGSVEVRGKVVRRGPFQGPVTLKLQGLPAGLEVKPLTVEPEAADFALVVEASADAKAAKVDAQLTVAFKLGEKDYATPPRPLTVEVRPAD